MRAVIATLVSVLFILFLFYSAAITWAGWVDGWGLAPWLTLVVTFAPICFFAIPVFRGLFTAIHPEEGEDE